MAMAKVAYPLTNVFTKLISFFIVLKWSRGIFKIDHLVYIKLRFRKAPKKLG